MLPKLRRLPEVDVILNIDVREKSHFLSVTSLSNKTKWTLQVTFILEVVKR